MVSSKKTAALPPLPLEAWEPTKITLHLYCQIIGKIRLGMMPKRNHWWHAPLYVSSRGVTTGLIPSGDLRFEIELDLISHQLGVRTADGVMKSFPLHGQPVAEFHAQLFEALGEVGVRPTIRGVPYDLPFKTPFAEDREHAAYDPEYATRFWRILAWTETVFWEFAGRFEGKTSPIHMFWHSFGLAMTRFSGRPAPEMEGANQVAREAYSHEVVSFGFWAGDPNVREAAYYSYTYPEPAGLRESVLDPAGAKWIEQRGGALAILPYEIVRTSGDPRKAVLQFLESTWRAGSRLADWPQAERAAQQP